MNNEHPNAKLIQRFYTSFKDRDYKGMIQCYHPSVDFSDALFDLRGDAVAAMWYMLCKNATDLDVTLIDFAANDEMGIAHWEATYNFSETGRTVHNVVEARFEFKDGKIIKHQDNWDFWKWSNMALGLMGRFFGWAPVIKNTVKQKAGKKLAVFMEEASSKGDPEYRISDREQP
ncbi:MAG: nuclear transport factor 2 family protein [Cyanobacteria bacterium RU_5_0]|nr:nuclear transport factor 2 family protein [Cyanobacteria bacterium RU_5_0]